MKPSTKFIVAGFPTRLVAPIPASASRTYWRSFSPFEWALVQSLIGGLDQPYIWENYSNDLRVRIHELMLPEEPPKTECPEPPPEQPGGGSSGGAIAGIGVTGLSVEELEGLLMGSVMAIRIENGVLQVQYFPCCDWVDVGSIADIVTQTTNTPKTFSEALAQGFSNLPATLPTLPHNDPAHNTPSSLACAKATAAVTQMKALIVDFRDSLETIPGGGLVLSAWVVILNALGLGALAYPFAIVRAVQKFGQGPLLDMYNDLLENDEFWDNAICSLTAQMDAYGSLTGQDVGAIYNYLVQNTILAVGAMNDILDMIVPTEYQRTVSQMIPETTCGCDLYKPYVPPTAPAPFIASMEAVRSYHMGEAAPATYNAPFSAEHGEIMGNGYFEWQDMGAGDIRAIRFGVLVAVPPGAEIREIRLTTVAGVAIDANATNNGFRVWGHDKLDLNAAWIMHSNGQQTVPGQPAPTTHATPAGTRSILVTGYAFETVAGDPGQIVCTTLLEISGNYNGEPYTWLRPPF